MAAATTLDHNGLPVHHRGQRRRRQEHLIGRLLYDSKSILRTSSRPESASSRHRRHRPQPLTDGLKAEREQGITIDVAYRYFATPSASSSSPTLQIIQYTRNMVTGASTADLAIILIDARHGLLEQTHRHSFIASLLGPRHAGGLRKQDGPVDYSEDRFNEIVSAYKNFSLALTSRTSTTPSAPYMGTMC